MILKKKPFKWVSAHRDIEFTFEAEFSFDIFSFSEGLTGNLNIGFTGDGIHVLSAGDTFYIGSGVYRGYHTIASVVGSSGYLFYLTNTPYTSAQSSGRIYYIGSSDTPTFDIWIGYESGSLSVPLPYTQVANFKPEPNLNGELVVNVSGYLNKIFDVLNSNETFDLGGLILQINTFNQFVLIADGVAISTHNILNAAIDMYELNEKYVDTGLNLNNIEGSNFFFSCGTTINFAIDGNFVKVVSRYSEGVKTSIGRYFGTGFSNGFQRTP